jgi:MSHA biogenesis protein MshL
VEVPSTRKIRLVAGAVLLVTAAQESVQVPAQAQSEPLRPLVVTQLDERQQGSDLDSTRPLSITLSDPTAITDLLLMIVRDTRLSVVPDPDVQGTWRGELKDVTLRQALEMILQPHGYDYSVQGNLIRVFKRRFETRRFDLNYVVTRRTSSRTLSSGGITSGSSAEVTGTDAGDIFSDVATGVQTLLSPDGRFNMDRKAALLQATDFPDRLDQIQLYLDAVQHRATRQVQIQAMVIEVELNDEFAAGIDRRRLNMKDMPAIMSALSSQGTVNVIATPTVTALNNEPAVMQVGLVHATALHAILEGVVLSVTPQIASDGMINMSIAPSLTARAGEAESRSGDTAPMLSVREAATVVRVHDKETIVVAGLMDHRSRPEMTKVPFFGDLPGVGRMFRGEKTSRRKTDLIILLTPTIMTPARVAQAAANELERVR